MPRFVRRGAKIILHAEFAVQPGAGHCPWLDDPEVFTARVGALLAGRPA